MQSCCFGFGSTEAVGQSFHHAERAPRVTSSLTAESPTIRSFQTILGVDARTLATRVLRARKTRKWLSRNSFWDPIFEIVCNFLIFAVEFTAPTTMYDLI